ncbi:MAG: hypothetical protein BGO96_00150 [Micrococcales bacterium 73-15]|uniref:hypothetical protein n=1 Tax=Salana multivorans TaxID=120377 RepID=UPI0009607717|nr:hypothetical protein [Salana multivorans]OJX93915.1 MAG: hypothetical protein BGO96_00150 [Micrococcales bacterium 73-15]
MRATLDDLLVSADPARPALDDPAVHAALADLVADTAAVEPLPLGTRRRMPVRRWAVPVAAGVLTLGATAAAAEGVFDLFSADSPIHLSTTHELAGGTGGCGLFVNVLPADGEARTDASGVTIQSGSPETFDQAEYDAVADFMATHDWDAELAGVEWENTTYDDVPGGGVEGSGTVDLDGVQAKITAALEREGLNAGGSADLVTAVSCGVSSDGSQPWSGS